jgi:TATA-binding protein-associated factor
MRKLEDVLKPTGDGTKDASVDNDVLKSLMLLRLLCTHPSLVSARESCSDNCELSLSGKLMALVDLFRNAGLDDGCITAADNDTSLLYCDDVQEDAVDDYDKVMETAEDMGLGWDDSKVISSGNMKCIVFAQFTKSLDLVEDLILNPLMPRVRYLRLDGRVPPEKRAELAQKFNADASIRLLLATTRVGGLGLNLTGTIPLPSRP